MGGKRHSTTDQRANLHLHVVDYECWKPADRQQRIRADHNECRIPGGRRDRGLRWRRCRQRGRPRINRAWLPARQNGASASAAGTGRPMGAPASRIAVTRPEGQLGDRGRGCSGGSPRRRDIRIYEGTRRVAVLVRDPRPRRIRQRRTRPEDERPYVRAELLDENGCIINQGE